MISVMKKIFFVFVALFVSLSVSAQSGKAIYNKYSDAQGVSAVYISPAMFRIMGRIPDLEIGEGEVNLAPVIKSLTGFYLLDSENREVCDNLNRDVAKFVSSSRLEPLIEIKDDGETVSIFVSESGDDITSIVILIRESIETTFICMDGRMSRDELEKILASAAAN